jgi:hypothetical protein
MHSKRSVKVLNIANSAVDFNNDPDRIISTIVNYHMDVTAMIMVE